MPVSVTEVVNWVVGGEVTEGGPCLKRLVGWLVGWSVALVGRLGWLGWSGWFVGWSVALVGWLVGLVWLVWLCGWLVGHQTL